MAGFARISVVPEIGMDVWWHNRVGMPACPGPRPIAEHRSLDPRPAFAAGQPFPR